MFFLTFWCSTDVEYSVQFTHLFMGGVYLENALRISYSKCLVTCIWKMWNLTRKPRPILLLSEVKFLINHYDLNIRFLVKKSVAIV